MKMTVRVERRHINASMTSGKDMIQLAMLEHGYDDVSIGHEWCFNGVSDGRDCYEVPGTKSLTIRSAMWEFKAFDLLKPFAFDLFVDGDGCVVKISEARNLEEASGDRLIEFDTSRIMEEA